MITVHYLDKNKTYKFQELNCANSFTFSEEHVIVGLYMNGIKYTLKNGLSPFEQFAVLNDFSSNVVEDNFYDASGRILNVNPEDMIQVLPSTKIITPVLPVFKEKVVMAMNLSLPDPQFERTDFVDLGTAAFVQMTITPPEPTGIVHYVEPVTIGCKTYYPTTDLTVDATKNWSIQFASGYKSQGFSIPIDQTKKPFPNQFQAVVVSKATGG